MFISSALTAETNIAQSQIVSTVCRQWNATTGTRGSLEIVSFKNNVSCVIGYLERWAVDLIYPVVNTSTRPEAYAAKASSAPFLNNNRNVRPFLCLRKESQPYSISVVYPSVQSRCQSRSSADVIPKRLRAMKPWPSLKKLTAVKS